MKSNLTKSQYYLTDEKKGIYDIIWPIIPIKREVLKLFFF